MVRSYLAGIAGLATLMAGCASPPTSTGWVFQVGRPCTVSIPAIVSHGTTITAAPVDAVTTFRAEAPCRPGPVPSPALAITAEACSLNDVYHRLNRIESRLSTAEEAQRLPALAPGRTTKEN